MRSLSRSVRDSGATRHIPDRGVVTAPLAIAILASAVALLEHRPQRLDLSQPSCGQRGPSGQRTYAAVLCTAANAARRILAGPCHKTDEMP